MHFFRVKFVFSFNFYSDYSSRVSSANPDKGKQTESNIFASVVNPYLDTSDWGWQIDPLGLRITMNEIYDRYQLPIFVVENGLGAYDTIDEDGKVRDSYRIEYLKKHIQAMKDAVDEDGVDLMLFQQVYQLSKYYHLHRLPEY